VGVLVRVRIADVAGRANQHVELAVGADLDEPAVRTSPGNWSLIIPAQQLIEVVLDLVM
jgi:hypothetical protein